jgi:hypothetical protein
VSSLTMNLKLTERMLLAPKEAFQALAPAYPWKVPFFLVLALSALAWTCYFLSVDIAWLVDHQIALLDKEMSERQMERARDMLTREYQLTAALITVLVLVPATYVLQALYFNVVGTLQGDDRGFRGWFSFVSWTSLPTVFVLVAMIAYVAVSDSRLATEDLAVLSVDGLFLHLDARSPWKSLLSNISLATVWSVVLMIAGYRRSIGTSMLSSCVIVVLPYIAVFGIWALFVS